MVEVDMTQNDQNDQNDYIIRTIYFMVTNVKTYNIKHAEKTLTCHYIIIHFLLVYIILCKYAFYLVDDESLEHNRHWITRTNRL